MSQIEKHLKWCLKDKNRLVQTKPNLELAKKHLQKSEYNYDVVLKLEKIKIYDWALNVGFYAVYHCFLAILTKYGYESRNQSCTISTILNLIEQKKLNFEKDIIFQFDTLETEKNIESPTARMEREQTTYGVQTSIDLKQLQKMKQLILTTQRETIKILNE